jgi:hypothetical protein
MAKKESKEEINADHTVGAGTSGSTPAGAQNDSTTDTDPATEGGTERRTFGDEAPKSDGNATRQPGNNDEPGEDGTITTYKTGETPSEDEE